MAAPPTSIRKPLYLDFAAGEVKEFEKTLEAVEVYSTIYTKVITYTATGAEGNPFTVADITNFVIVAVMRAGAYKRITVDAVSDYETIKITGTLLEDNNGGILSTNGQVTLNSGDALIANEKIDFIYYG
jgi:hypothetical protein